MSGMRKLFAKPQLDGQPKPLSGFEHINRYWDPGRQVFAAKLLPGEYYVTISGEMITTVLGSCVSACIRDTMLGIGGMNHFMLPERAFGEPGSWDDTNVNSATRYGSFAMEHLINVILQQGSQRNRLEVKIFGGGKVLRAMTDIGNRNIAFVRNYLRDEGLRVTSEDVGDICPRKVVYYPDSGRVLVKKLYTLHNDTIIQREQQYMQDLEHQPVAGEIDLF